MTAEQKTAVARFLNLTEDYLKNGHRRDRKTPVFSAEQGSAVEESGQGQADFSSLPLAYQVDEDEEHLRDIPTEYSPEYSEDSLEAVAAEIRACKACGLAPTRTLAVPGEGVERPLVMVIGEGPGADEDRAGRPFVGRAGQLLDKMLDSIGLSRGKNCFIANMVKCRPPGNRYPAPEEITACFPYLKRQIALLRPRVILCAGRAAAQNLLKTSKGINALRGTFDRLILNRSDGLGMNQQDGLRFESEEEAEEEIIIPVFCILHPSALLRDETLKRPTWEDLKLLKAHLDSLGEE